MCFFLLVNAILKVKSNRFKKDKNKTWNITASCITKSGHVKILKKSLYMFSCVYFKENFFRQESLF